MSKSLVDSVELLAEEAAGITSITLAIEQAIQNGDYDPKHYQDALVMLTDLTRVHAEKLDKLTR